MHANHLSDTLAQLPLVKHPLVSHHKRLGKKNIKADKICRPSSSFLLLELSETSMAMKTLEVFELYFTGMVEHHLGHRFCCFTKVLRAVLLRFGCF